MSFAFKTIAMSRGLLLTATLLSVGPFIRVARAEEHFGQVQLRAVVRASTAIRVTPTALASNLDIDGDAASGPIATIHVFSNTRYRIRLFSDNWVTEGGTDPMYFLRQAGTSAADAGGSLGERIHYALTFDGQGIVPDTEGSYLVVFGEPTGNVGRTASLNIVIQGNDNYSAGVYSDFLTITVSPDTSFPIN
jgi:hypothetical protein